MFKEDIAKKLGRRNLMSKLRRGKWMNGTIYPCKRIGQYPQLYFERTQQGNHKMVSMSFFYEKNKEGIKITLKKSYANLMLRHLKMCLEEL